MFACKDAAGIWDDEKKKKQNAIRLQVVKYKYSVKKVRSHIHLQLQCKRFQI